MRKILVATMFLMAFVLLLLLVIGIFNVPCTPPSERALCRKELGLLRGYLLGDDFFDDGRSCTNEIAFRVGTFCERVNQTAKERLGKSIFRVVASSNKDERIIMDRWGTPYNFISIEERQRNNWDALKYSEVSNIVMWSSGPNKINEYGTNDDVVLGVQPEKQFNESNDRSGFANCRIESSLLTTLQRILIEEYDTEIDQCTLSFHAETFLTDAALQREIQHQLTLDHQKEMDEALRTSGNVNNPKLAFLYSALKPAIVKSASMTYLARCADSYGYSPSVHILGGEKLQFRRQSSHAERFVEPECRIYGIWGFTVRKRGVESKKSLTARFVRIGANENVISDEIKKIENIKSGTCGD